MIENAVCDVLGVRRGLPSQDVVDQHRWDPIDVCGHEGIASRRSPVKGSK
jgi:hypothetical protein